MQQKRRVFDMDGTKTYRHKNRVTEGDVGMIYEDL